MTTTSSRDNWERLVAAVIKRDQIWQLCHQDSITTVDSDFSQNLSLGSVSPSPPPQLPFTNDSDVKAGKHNSGTIKLKLFSGLLWRTKSKDYDLGECLAGIPEDHFGLEKFSLEELRLATDDFSSENILERGTFSKVYKGRLEDGSVVAVKRLTAEESDVMIREELEISSIVAHCNVIGVRGFCITKKVRLLVYPYMVNGSVSQCLRERRKSQPPLGWAIRLRIALGVARGLAYLHHKCTRSIIHRDVKAANILLDEDFEAFVADFTLAKFVDCYDKDGIKGTIGHIAPEYVSTGECSLKTDVYGYGVFLLELITGQRTFDLARLASDDDMTYLDWVKRLCEEKNFETIVDRDLGGNFVEEEVDKLLRISLICTQTDPEGRPTMPEVVRMLEVGYGFIKTWELSQNVNYEDEKYSSKMHPTSEGIIDEDSSFNI